MKRVFLSMVTVWFLLSSLAAQQANLKAASALVSTATPETPSADKIWALLMEGNDRFVAGTASPRSLVSLRTTLAKGQHPKAIVLACSDSRVAPELLFDQSLGDLFVVRSAGNIADAIGEGSMEYAFDHLGSTVLVVLGHTKCGAVTAACSRQRMPTPNLQAIVDRINPAVTQVGESAQGDALIEAAVKQNVHQSANDVLSNSTVLHRAWEEGKLTIYEAEYDLETGRVTRLESSLRK